MLSPRLKVPNIEFPSIFRFIPETASKHRKPFLILGIIAIFLISALLLASSINQYAQLQKNQENLAKITTERAVLENEIAYWENIAANYKNYPDIYLKISSLEYRLNNIQLAKNYLDKALSQKPDSEQAVVLGEYIGK